MNRLFAGLAPVIAAEFAILLDDSVAGDHQGDGRHLGVAHHLGWRDLEQCPPDADLKIGAAHVQRDGAIRRLAAIEHGVDDLLGA